MLDDLKFGLLPALAIGMTVCLVLEFGIVKRRNGAKNPALQALEAVVRFFLLKANGQAPDFPKTGAKDTSITYTDYRSLRGLIRLYNENLTGAEAQYLCTLEYTRGQR